MLAEIDHPSSHGGVAPVQWTLVVNNASVLRGMHVHPRHTDWVVVVMGEVLAAIVDLRRDAGTPQLTAMFALSASRLRVLEIPPGVLHGFYSRIPSMMFIGASQAYDSADDLAVRFDDPRLGLAWGGIDPVLSERDRDAPPLERLLAELERQGMPVADYAS
jgi:dTDP-4-dehydrorhamnose 3,5-epimerase